MNKMKYKTLLFDADGTLFDFNTASKCALEKAFKAHSLKYSEEVYEIYRRINEQKWKEFEAQLISNAELRTSRFAGLFAELEVSGMEPGPFNTEYLDYLAEGSQLLDGAYSVCATLAKTHTLALITNGFEKIQLRRYNNSSIKPFVPYIFISETLGYAKPDTRYFDAVFQGLGHPQKAEVLVIGDSLTSDIKGGNDYGLDTCYFNPNNIENALGIQPTYEISFLQEVLGLV